MSTSDMPLLGVTNPVSWVGRRTIEVAGYFGGMGILLTSTLKALWQNEPLSATFQHEIRDELHWMFMLGMPLIGLIHIGLGSFLALQGYYGGTFVEGTGAIVGVGLIRNVAPLMACQVLAIILAARITPEIRRDYGQKDEPTTPRVGLLDRPSVVVRDIPASPKLPPVSRAICVRVVAGTITGCIMGLWGSAVGTLVGWAVSKSLMGVTSHSFFHMFWDMLWTRDIVGLFVKGSAFGMVATLLACQEGIRGRSGATVPELASSACRAACLAMTAILVINGAWFVMLYHAGPAFGPTLLKPPMH